MCLVGKIKSSERLQNKADDRYYARGVNNILYEFRGGKCHALLDISEKESHRKKHGRMSMDFSSWRWR